MGWFLFIVLALAGFMWIGKREYDKEQNKIKNAKPFKKKKNKNIYKPPTQPGKPTTGSYMGPKKRPANIKIYNDVEDNFEGWFYEEISEHFEINKKLHLVYKDGSGNITERDIKAYKFGKAMFGGFILAYCYLREENRTFRTDRIIECIDLDTGEYINNISKYLMDSYYKSDEYKEIQEIQKRQEEREANENYYNDFVKKHDVLLKVLVYLVKCDGTYNQREKAIIKELLENIEQNNTLLSDKMLDKIFKNFVIPTPQSFKIAVTKLLNENKYNIDLLEITKNIIATQKTIHPAEQEALEYIATKLDVKEDINIDLELKKQCPKCSSKQITKKGQRKFKNHTNQRYQCQECKTTFSERINQQKEE